MREEKPYTPDPEPGREVMLVSRIAKGVRYKYIAADGAVFETTATDERFARIARDAWKCRRANGLPL